MKKRLRKKKRVGEYQELGFELRAELNDDLAEAERDKLLSQLLAVIEDRKLDFTGYIRPGLLEGFVAHAGRGSATNEDRAALLELLKGQGALKSHQLGELRDAWYGW